ncbi:DNA mismatch repair domain protein [Marvinbryantia formatexigens DSM 14469]|uniref:DNA mismatch repair protein MutL n=1 Tax=Marvinbryantia formatexigens DSM 14469 TaxID=478749 RepID=C6LCC4_9FIRM|nr:DNA mismatch repair endonuclease MutL [Marvinbryantia formatexigens]EET61588.1 DNA mismatch repair domain protein [Marvinbryantia formatexigens DSM 14469]UWO24581.1 DNA mismatch repair endonuclease MutL [Marvinbryantia formatexigens DSM 14469]SDF14269.1 DNA mismatch repair protein MutL [Marvinbryantia formatexigens]
MREIAVLDEQTIDKIAAGEVIERPASIVKELVENAIDAGANAVTVEIKDGGISLIRITDNGSGIEAKQVPVAFWRHATSKIRKADDLLDVTSLGFRGEALSSIAAVCQVELITKTADSLTGVRYLIEGGKEKSLEEIGAPDGTTFLVRNIFYNTPARKKFLKTAQTEAGYISDMVERIALSHPEVSFKFIANNQTKLHTSGNHQLKDIIYHIYGRDIAANLIEISAGTDSVRINGFIGKPVISRGNRNYENYFVNGRYIRSNIIAKAIEDAYHTFMMKHKYPFTVLNFTIDGKLLDVNVHPAKLELRFAENEEMYRIVYEAVRNALTHREMIVQVGIGKEEAQKKETPKGRLPAPEPFEAVRRSLSQVRERPAYAKETAPGTAAAMQTASRRADDVDRMRADSTIPGPGGTQAAGTIQGPDGTQIERTIPKLVPPDASAWRSRMSAQTAETVSSPAFPDRTTAAEASTEEIPEWERALNLQPEAGMSGNPMQAEEAASGNSAQPEAPATGNPVQAEKSASGNSAQPEAPAAGVTGEQMSLFEDDKLLSKEHVKEHRIIGQVFDTYWIVQFKDKLFLIDQHAAHEKVLYERMKKSMEKREFTSQLLNPPVILTLSMAEEELLKKYQERFREIGFEIEEFGGREYALRAVPDNLFGLADKDLFLEMLDGLSAQTDALSIETIDDKIATMSCKAAVKGNSRLSTAEIHALIDELLTLENPYNCPHGRPTIISMSKYEIERKFKRIV